MTVGAAVVHPTRDRGIMGEYPHPMTYPPNPPSDPNQNPYDPQNPYGSQSGPQSGPQGTPDQPTTQGSYSGGQWGYQQPPAGDQGTWGAGGYPAGAEQPVDMSYPDLAPDAQKGFFAALFDLSFRSFVTLRVVPILYVISLVLLSIMAVIMFIAALISSISLFSDGYGGEGFLNLVVALILVPLGWLIYVVFARVLYEFFIAIIRIAGNTDPRHTKS